MFGLRESVEPAARDRPRSATRTGTAVSSWIIIVIVTRIEHGFHENLTGSSWLGNRGGLDDLNQFGVTNRAFDPLRHGRTRLIRFIATEAELHASARMINPT
jgi:hypothetical protein